MMLLRLITWPYVRKHRLRTILTTVGIVLGVAVFVGMHTANQSVLFAFYKTIDRIAGKAELQITAGEGGFPEDVLEQVQAMPEVRVAVPVIEAPVDTNLKGEGNLLILAVDMTGDRSLRDYDLESGDEAVVDDPLVFLAQPDSLIVTREFADRNGIEIGTQGADAHHGRREAVHRARHHEVGRADAGLRRQPRGDGHLRGPDGVRPRPDVRPRRPCAATKAWRSPTAGQPSSSASGPGFQVEPPSSRGQQIDSVLRVYSFTANINSAFALFIGMFIIYNSFSIAVAQRRREIGILRALGASRGQVRTLFLVESGLAGLVGSVLGLGFGVLLARGLALYISGLIAGVYGIAERTTEIATEPRLMLIGLLMGVVTSVVAGWIPARNASRVDPIQALQKGRDQVALGRREPDQAGGGDRAGERVGGAAHVRRPIDGAVLLGFRDGRRWPSSC